MKKLVVAVVILTALVSTAEAKRKPATHAQSATCAALRQLHAQVGTAGLEAMAAQAGVTPSQRAAAIACLRR